MTFDTKTLPIITNVSRRNFLQGTAGVFVLAATLRSLPAHAEKPPKFAGEGMPHGLREKPLLFLALNEDGTVTFTCHRSEMGQGVRTGLTMIVADELEADWSKMKLVQADGDEEKYGNQDTDGSRTTRHHFMTMRRVGAAARMMLEAAAAAQMGVPVSEVKAVNHEVVHAKTGRKLGYGALAKAASALPVPGEPKLKESADFRYIGKANPELIDAFDITTGKAIYGIDTRVDGMLYAVVARPPVYLGKVKSFDATETMKVPGVVKVVQIEGTPPPSEFAPLGGIGIVAKNTWAALKGREALKVEWDLGPHASYSSDSYRKQLEAVTSQKGKVVREEGDVEAAMAKAAKRVVASYYIPHLAQAPMEAPAAVVRIKDGKCEAWGCIQSPQAARERLANRLGITADNVTVHVTLLGGGFGRKSKPDFFVEAGLMSQAVDGAPVKLIWTREDDLQNGYYHTVSVERLEAGLDESGKPIAWLHRSAAPSIGSTFAANVKTQIPIELGMGLVNTPFVLPNARFENPEAENHNRIGWYRSVSNIPRAFAVQSFVAELAAAAGRDPKDYLLELIGPPRQIDPYKLGDSWNHGEDPSVYPIDTGRLRAVIEKAAEGIGWGRAVPKGHGLGIAGHYSFVSYIGVAAEVAVNDKNELSIPKAVIAIDCGPRVYNDRVRSQLEGAMVMGLSNSIYSEISYKNGAVEQSNFDGYQVSRIDIAPAEVVVQFVGGDNYSQPLGGVGEPGVPPVAPAIFNAIFAATGKRIRTLPLRLHDLSSA